MHGLLAIRDLRYLRPLQFKLPAARTRRIMACTASWHSLGTPRGELVLDNTLPTGQSFRWRRTGSGTYTGVIGQRLVQVQQADDNVLYQVLARGPATPAAEDSAALHDYFNLGTNLLQLSEAWAAADPRFAHVRQYLPGARMLRQDPVDCLFQFICSSNNHISRIHGMVERLCSSYGTPLVPTHPLGDDLEGAGLQEPPTPPPTNTPAAAAAAAAGGAAGGGVKRSSSSSKTTRKKVTTTSSSSSQEAGPTTTAAGATSPSAPAPFYAFPTLQQLAAATEEDLRAAGFGYRAKFITGSVAQLLAQPEGGEAWLLGLRQVSYQEAVEQLITLPGIGPKVAACVALFSLDKHQAVPVDTHVWNLATRHYAPRLAGKSLTPKLHGEVQRAFEEVFGAYAGWAHNTLFIAELASHRSLVPALPKAPTAAAVDGTGGGLVGHSPSSSGSLSGLSSGSAGGDAADSGSGEEWQPVQTPGKASTAAAGADTGGGNGREMAGAPERSKRKRQPSAKAAGRGKMSRKTTTVPQAAAAEEEDGTGKRSKKLHAVAAAHGREQQQQQQQQEQGSEEGAVEDEMPLPLQPLLAAAAGAARAKRTRRVQPKAQASAAGGTSTLLPSGRAVAAGQLLVAAAEDPGNSMKPSAAALTSAAARGQQQQQQQCIKEETGDAGSSSPDHVAASKARSWAAGTTTVPRTPVVLGGSVAPMEGSPGVAVLVSAGTAVGGSDA